MKRGKARPDAMQWQLVSQLLSFVDDGDSAMLEVGLTVAGDCEGATMYIFFVFICISLKFCRHILFCECWWKVTHT